MPARTMPPANGWPPNSPLDLEVLTMDFLLHPSTIAGALHLLVLAPTTVRVIMERPETGVALAWLFLVAALPFFGRFDLRSCRYERSGEDC